MSYYALSYFLCEEKWNMPPYIGHDAWTPAADKLRAQLAALFAVMTDAERREVFNGVKA